MYKFSKKCLNRLVQSQWFLLMLECDILLHFVALLSLVKSLVVCSHMPQASPTEPAKQWGSQITGHADCWDLSLSCNLLVFRLIGHVCVAPGGVPCCTLHLFVNNWIFIGWAAKALCDLGFYHSDYIHYSAWSVSLFHIWSFCIVECLKS